MSSQGLQLKSGPQLAAPNLPPQDVSALLRRTCMFPRGNSKSRRQLTSNVVCRLCAIASASKIPPYITGKVNRFSVSLETPEYKAVFNKLRVCTRSYPDPRPVDSVNDASRAFSHSSKYRDGPACMASSSKRFRIRLIDIA